MAMVIKHSFIHDIQRYIKQCFTGCVKRPDIRHIQKEDKLIPADIWESPFVFQIDVVGMLICFTDGSSRFGQRDPH